MTLLGFCLCEYVESRHNGMFSIAIKWKSIKLYQHLIPVLHDRGPCIKTALYLMISTVWLIAMPFFLHTMVPHVLCSVVMVLAVAVKSGLNKKWLMLLE